MKCILYCFYISIIALSCKKDQISTVASASTFNNSVFEKNGLVFIMKDRHPGTIYALDANSGAVKWQYSNDTDVESFSASPCVAGNTLFTGVTSYGNAQSSSYKTILAAFNARTGNLSWRTILNNGLTSLTNPTFENGVVYIAAEKKLFAVNAATGNINWNMTIDSGTSDNELCSPTVINGTIYIGNKKHLFALNAADGSTKWQRNANLAYSSPTVSNGFITFVDHTNGAIKAFDTSGNPKWLFKKAGYLIGSTTTNNNFVYQGIGYPFTTLNSFALQSNDGAFQWNYTQTIDNTVDNSTCGDPFYFNNTLYVALRDSVFAISATGAHNKKWSYFTGTPGDNSFSSSSPVAGNGIVYVMTVQKVLYALNEISGALIWQFNVGGEHPIYSPVILYNDGTAIHATGSGMTQ
ncbi:MAG: PQQ-binding-like beta-propeller repeat protein [Parafilimonas sp.]